MNCPQLPADMYFEQGFFVMLDHEKSAGYVPSLEDARVIGHNIAATEPLICDVSIYSADAKGELVKLVETLRTIHDTPPAMRVS